MSLQDTNKIIYTFTKNDIIKSKDDTLLFKFPYEKDVFWTSFRFTINNEKRTRKITTKLITTDNYEYSIDKLKNISPNNWNDLKWIIPSINTNNSGIYLDIQSINYDIINSIIIQLKGYKNLLPKNDNYILISEYGYEYVLTKYEDNETNEIGVIYNVEGIDYIRDIIDKAYLINIQV
jgi:hypothetical protein